MRSVMEPWLRAVLIGSALCATSACSSGDGGEGSEDGGVTDAGGDAGADAVGNGDAGGNSGTDSGGGEDTDSGADAGDPDAEDPDSGDPDAENPDVDGPDVEPGPLDTRFEGELRDYYAEVISFEFSCTQPPCTFQCAVVVPGARQVDCTSPWEVTGLSEGQSTVSVQAVNSQGEADATPALHTFVVDRTTPATLSETEVPSVIRSPREFPALEVTCDDATASTLECQIGDEAWRPCTSPIPAPSGENTTVIYKARCVDAAGTPDPSPLLWVFTYDSLPPALQFLVDPPVRLAASQPAEFRTRCDDATGCRFECELDGDELGDCAFPLTLPELSVGEHRLRIRAFDAAENASDVLEHTWIVESAWSDIALGNDFHCGVTTDGDTFCWGELNELDGSSLNEVDPTSMGLPDASQVAISTRGDSACVVLTDGSVVCRGANEQGQLGRGLASTAEYNWEPVVRVGGVTSLEMGAEHACATTSAGQLYCWGSNLNGQIDPSDMRTRFETPYIVGFPSPAVEVALGDEHTCALLESGAVFCWGTNSSGQLGRPTGGAAASPSPIAEDGTWVAIDAGARHTCALSNLDYLWCWGDNSSGQLGLGDAEVASVNTPQLVWPEPLTAMDTWGQTTCFTRTGGLECAGELDMPVTSGGASTGGFTYLRRSPAQVLQLSDGAVCEFDRNGFVACSGERWWDTLPSQSVDFPVEPQDTGWAEIHLSRGGVDLGCALKSDDRSLWCWGESETGATFSRGSAFEATIPSEVLSGLSWRDVAVQGSATCGVADFGGILCIGSNTNGLLGNTSVTGESFTPVTPDLPGNDWREIEAGLATFCARRDNGTVWCWGMNLAGEAGTGNRLPVTTPQQVGTANDWVALAMGDLRTCGLRESSAGERTLWCWGAQGAVNDQVPVQVGDEAAWTSIATNAAFDFAIREGRLFAAGRMASEDDGRPEPVSQFLTWSWLRVNGRGGRHCGVSTAGELRCWGDFDMTAHLGPGFDTGAAQPTTPPIGIGATATSVHVADDYACALDDTGGRWCWGTRTRLQLGDGFSPWEPIEFVPPTFE